MPQGPRRFAFPSPAAPGRFLVVERKEDGTVRIKSAVSERYLSFSDRDGYELVRQVAFAILDLTEKDDENDTT